MIRYIFNHHFNKNMEDCVHIDSSVVHEMIFIQITLSPLPVRARSQRVQ